jgi:hypothetical protein
MSIVVSENACPSTGALANTWLTVSSHPIDPTSTAPPITPIATNPTTIHRPHPLSIQISTTSPASTKAAYAPLDCVSTSTTSVKRMVTRINTPHPIILPRCTLPLPLRLASHFGSFTSANPPITITGMIHSKLPAISVGWIPPSAPGKPVSLAGSNAITSLNPTIFVVVYLVPKSPSPGPIPTIASRPSAPLHPPVTSCAAPP